MDAQWKVKRLGMGGEVGGEVKALDASEIADALIGLNEEIDDCPGNIGCAGAKEDHFLVSAPNGNVGYVLGPTVVWEGKRRRDAQGKFDYLGRKAFDGHAEIHVVPAGACKQGKPADYERWTAEEYWLQNSCMNYAIDHRWDRSTGGANGMHPCTDVREWTNFLARFGIEERDALPDATDDGWPIALFFKPNERLESTGEFHFLRLLTSGVWTHKFSARRPALCDFSGNAMPKDSVQTASLCGYKFAAYYWVKKGTTISNRTK